MLRYDHNVLEKVFAEKPKLIRPASCKKEKREEPPVRTQVKSVALSSREESQFRLHTGSRFASHIRHYYSHSDEVYWNPAFVSFVPDLLVFVSD
jgi:hypothetical protein